MEKSKNHSAAFSFPMIPEQMVFIWGTFFFMSFFLTKMPRGTKGVLGRKRDHVSPDHFDSCDDEMRV